MSDDFELFQYYFLLEGLIIFVCVADLYLIIMIGDVQHLKPIGTLWESIGLIFLLLISIPPIMLNEECDHSAQVFLRSHHPKDESSMVIQQY